MGRSSTEHNRHQNAHHATPRDDNPLVLRNERYKAVLHNGRLDLEALAQNRSAEGGKERNMHVFPEMEHAFADITCIGLTAEFLVYGTRSGSLFYYYLDEQGPLAVNEYRHVDCGISRLWLNTSGSRAIFRDDQHCIYLYNPMLPISGFSGTLEVVVWDASDNNIFVLAERSQNFVYVYSPMNICCPRVTFLGVSPRPDGFHPSTLENGILKCRLDNGAIKDVILHTHQCKHKVLQGNNQVRERFDENLALQHFKEAWNDAFVLKSAEVWDIFTRKALEQMELEIAMKSCQQSKNIKMLMYLNQLEYIENRNLLAGHILLLFGDHDAAQVPCSKPS